MGYDIENSARPNSVAAVLFTQQDSRGLNQFPCVYVCISVWPFVSSTQLPNLKTNRTTVHTINYIEMFSPCSGSDYTIIVLIASIWRLFIRTTRSNTTTTTTTRYTNLMHASGANYAKESTMFANRKKIELRLRIVFIRARLSSQEQLSQIYLICFVVCVPVHNLL